METKQKGTVVAVCTSDRKGVAKTDVGSCLLIEDYGLENDAHAGNWHRQVSLLSHDKVEAFRRCGGEVADGAFGENLLVSGIDFAKLPVGMRLRGGKVLLEVTQIGKECHAHCAIYHQVGDCIMPREGVFARVLQGGTVTKGDELYVEE
jgi:TatD DNase family protein